jgi:uncharacterized protein (DUF362 family)
MAGDRRVFVDVFDDQRQSSIESALAWLKWGACIAPDTRVFLKPNLTWKTPTPGVTTGPAVLEAVVAILRARTKRIIVGESDGGYHAFKAEEAFETHGLYRLKKNYDIQLVNLSSDVAVKHSVEVGRRQVEIELPRTLLSDIDLFVTLPVPKVHVMTGVSLGFKNQWGCQPSTMRLRNHPVFSSKVMALNKALRPSLALYDGTYFLDKSGPMAGDPIQMNLVIAATDVGAGDLVCCTIMGIDPQRIEHLLYAQREGMMPRSLDGVVLNQNLERFPSHRFSLRRTPLNYIALAAFHSRVLTRFFYDSSAAGPIHTALDRLRRISVIRRLLCGRFIGPSAEP